MAQGEWQGLWVLSHFVSTTVRIFAVIVLRIGDADVAFLAGAKYRKTDKSEMMGVTTVFSAAGVDKKKFLDHTGTLPPPFFAHFPLLSLWIMESRIMIKVYKLAQIFHGILLSLSIIVYQ